MKRTSIELPIDQIAVRMRVRGDDGDLAPLEASIRKMGLLHPILVDRNGVLISGGRRLQACKNIGHTSIQAIRFDILYSSMEALDIQTDDNLCILPLSQADIEEHIASKKRKIGEPGSGLASWIKRTISTKQSESS